MQRDPNEPTCPKHGRIEDWQMYAKISGNAPVRYIAQFTCTQCPIVVAALVPTCPECKVNMTILEDSGKLFWNCSLHEQLQDFELCECGGYGYVEMQSDKHALVEDGFEMLGHDGGKHIERCDGCRGVRFLDDIEAERAHRKECGCGHGLPTMDRAYRWINYPGRNMEIYHAMQRAGFPTEMLTDEEVQVTIPKGQALLFIATMDACYDNMHLEFEKRSRQPPQKKPPGAPVCFSQYFDPNDKWECGPCHFREACAESTIEARQPTAKPSFGQIARQCAGVKDEDPNTSSGKASIISKAQMREMGFRQLYKRNGKATVTRQGYPVGYLMGRKLSEEETETVLKANQVENERVEELVKASKRLFDALNGMNFQYHPRDEVRELESRRRGFKDAMALLQASRHPGDVGGRDADRKMANWGEFHDAGGYRIESLRKLDDEAVLQGVIYIHGSMHHIQFVEVHDVNGEQKPVNDPYNRYYDGVGRFADYSMETTKVTGYPGDYVMFIFPREG